MPVIRRTDRDDVDFLFLEQFPVIAIYVQLAVELLIEFGGVHIVHVTSGNHAAKLGRRHRDARAALVLAATTSNANRSDGQFAVCILSFRSGP